MAQTKRPLREVATVVALSVVLSFVYNSFSSKGLPLIRKEVGKEAVSDSVLFGTQDTAQNKSPRDSIDRSAGNVSAPPRVQPPDGSTSGEPPKKPPQKPARQTEDQPAGKHGEKPEVYRIISLEQMKRLLSGGHNVLFDARDTAAYRKGHIKGARNVPGLEAEEHFEEFVTIPRDTLILIYCNNPDCHLGRMLADFMGAIGFTKLYLYDDGWDGWEKAKMPVDSSNGGRR